MNKKKKREKKQKELRLFHKRWKKELKRRRRRKRDRRYGIKRHSYSRKLGKNIQKHKKNVIVSDKHLSISNNSKSTIEFLNKILKSLKECIPVYIDVSKVEIITVDALLYLLAIIDNMKYQKIPVHIAGNLPQTNDAKNIFLKSGFLNYVNSNASTVSTTVECIQIYDGRDADSSIAKKMCEFTIDKLNLDRIQTKDLYNIIMEIIINTKQHAYCNKQSNLPKWYAYARCENNNIHFSLLDTGVGIPKTVNKNWTEKVNELVAKIPLIKKSDSKLLNSVAGGEFRTKTQEKYRGKGIPMIVSHSKNGYIKDLTIVSNYGFVSIDNNHENDLTTPLNGTLYYWRIENGN